MRNLDYGLFLAYIVLMLFGLVMIYSASMMIAVAQKEFAPDYFYTSQLRNILVSFVAFTMQLLYHISILVEKKSWFRSCLLW